MGISRGLGRRNTEIIRGQPKHGVQLEGGQKIDSVWMVEFACQVAKHVEVIVGRDLG